MHNSKLQKRTKFYLNQQNLYPVLKMLGLADILMQVPFQASLLKTKNRVNICKGYCSFHWYKKKKKHSAFEKNIFGGSVQYKKQINVSFKNRIIKASYETY